MTTAQRLACAIARHPRWEVRGGALLFNPASNPKDAVTTRLLDASQGVYFGRWAPVLDDAATIGTLVPLYFESLARRNLPLKAGEQSLELADHILQAFSDVPYGEAVAGALLQTWATEAGQEAA